MPNTIQEKEGMLNKAISLVKQFPWVAFCLWMGYRDITREALFDKKEKEQVARDVDRETFYRSQLTYMREQMENEKKHKEEKLTELNNQNGQSNEQH